MMKKVYDASQLASLPAQVMLPVRGCKTVKIINVSPWWLTLSDGEGSLMDVISPWSFVVSPLDRPNDHLFVEGMPGTAVSPPESSANVYVSFDASASEGQPRHYQFGSTV